MCCLFGIIDYRHSLSQKQLNRMLSVLATACEERGTDATGIAYNDNGYLRIYKRPKAAHKMHFNVPEHTHVVMGHTRMMTQGNAKKNYNNHPVPGHVKAGDFALAHNGVLYNDETLRESRHLPKTKIETDSYIAVQLIEEKKTLDFNSLKRMAEDLMGSFTFTVMDGQDNMYFVRGDNPMALYHFPRLGLYMYASTESILQKALKKLSLSSEMAVLIDLRCGDLLKIDHVGIMTRARFDDSNLCTYYPMYSSCYSFDSYGRSTYIDDLKSVARCFGFEPEAVDRLLHLGFQPEEIEEYFYAGEI